jgi:hypothetical protein
MLHFLQEDTISINHNWLNGCNVDISWEYIKQGLRDVENEIRDIREEKIKDKTWYQDCQVLKSYKQIQLDIHIQRYDLVFPD